MLKPDQQVSAASAQAPAILELRKLEKRYADFYAVKQVNIRLGRGEFVTFLGPSGSGKTTTLQMIAGLQNATSGEIILNEEPIDPLPSHKRNIGMVFQNYALFPHMTAAANVAFPLEMRKFGRDEIARKVSAILEKVGLKGFGDRYPGQLSGGQQQRVALARALVFEPPLLLMDEPLGALDKKLREQLQLEIMRIHRELDTAIIYVTHDQEEALVMSDRIAVFNEGRIEQIGTAAELYEHPASVFAAGFLGDTNLFPGRVSTVRDSVCAVTTKFGMVSARATHPLAAGDEVVVSVRPERIDLDRVDSDDRIDAMVHEVIYLGGTRKFIVRLKTGQTVLITRPIYAPEGNRLTVGESVTLSWQAIHATALPSKADFKRAT